MPYRISIEREATVLRAVVKGSRVEERAVTNALAFWEQVADHLRESRLDRVLVIWEIAESLATLSAWKIVEALPDIPVSRRSRFAIVIPDDESRVSNEFAAELARNRGYRVRVFESEDPARAWLVSED